MLDTDTDTNSNNATNSGSNGVPDTDSCSSDPSSHIYVQFGRVARCTSAVDGCHLCRKEDAI